MHRPHILRQRGRPLRRPHGMGQVLLQWNRHGRIPPWRPGPIGEHHQHNRPESRRARRCRSRHAVARLCRHAGCVGGTVDIMIPGVVYIFFLFFVSIFSFFIYFSFRSWEGPDGVAWFSFFSFLFYIYFLYFSYIFPSISFHFTSKG